MIAVNLSVDFELGWGDLERVARDDFFYRRVLGGLEQTESVIRILELHRIPSTWGVVGGCCSRSIDELRQRAPDAFPFVERKLMLVREGRTQYAQVLFCREVVETIAGSRLIDLGSHGFMHLVPKGLDTRVLHQDVAISTQTLREISGREIESFIPPQNYVWPELAFAGTSIRFVRHTPRIFGYDYSEPALPAKLSRLWNDLFRPVQHVGSRGESAQLVFLRIDRGESIWCSQMRLIRKLFARGAVSIDLFTHPHNLHAPQVVERFAHLCELIAEYHDRGRLTFRKFIRELVPRPSPPDAS